MLPEYILVEGVAMLAIILISAWRVESIRRELSNAQCRLDRLQDDNARLRDDLAKERHIDNFEYDDNYDEGDFDADLEVKEPIDGEDSTKRPVA